MKKDSDPLSLTNLSTIYGSVKICVPLPYKIDRIISNGLFFARKYADFFGRQLQADLLPGGEVGIRREDHKTVPLTLHPDAAGAAFEVYFLDPAREIMAGFRCDDNIFRADGGRPQMAVAVGV